MNLYNASDIIKEINSGRCTDHSVIIQDPQKNAVYFTHLVGGFGKYYVSYETLDELTKFKYVDGGRSLYNAGYVIIVHIILSKEITYGYLEFLQKKEIVI